MCSRQDTSHDQNSILDPDKKKEWRILIAAILFCLICETLYVTTTIIWPIQCSGQIMVYGLGGIAISFAEWELEELLDLRSML